MKTAHTLSKAGVSSDKIIFVPNRISPDSEVEDVLAPVFEFVKRTKIGKISKNLLFITVKFSNISRITVSHSKH
ncbi:hypothetical protein [Shigella flexneri]|nr:hypothetical protein [Shigella flexneri]AMN66273.1 hypothetical protein AD871_28260 [Shigella flexneri 4c]